MTEYHWTDLPLTDLKTNLSKHGAQGQIVLKSGHIVSVSNIRGPVDHDSVHVYNGLGGWSTVLKDEIAAITALPRDPVRL